MAGVLPTQGPELRVSDVAVGQRDVARTLLPLNTSSEIDLVVQRHFRNCGLSLITRSKVSTCATNGHLLHLGVCGGPLRRNVCDTRLSGRW